MERFQLSAIDIGIMLLYGVLIIAYGLYHASARVQKSIFLPEGT